jgi:hypothetical protein
MNHQIETSEIEKYGPLELRPSSLLYDREVFEAVPRVSGADQPTMLVVLTDRIATDGIVHTNPIPRKGEVLAAMLISQITDNFTRDVADFFVYGQAITKHVPDDLTFENKGLAQSFCRRSFVLKKWGPQLFANELLGDSRAKFSWLENPKEGSFPDSVNIDPARPIILKAWGNGEKAPLKFMPLAMHNLSRAYIDYLEGKLRMSLAKFQFEHLDP